VLCCAAVQVGRTGFLIKIKVAGQIKAGKAKGTITFDGTTAYCNTLSFSGKYYGKHPQG
jgi:hypothetical protein